MKTTRMIAKIASIILAGMMVIGLTSCESKADKVSGNTYTTSFWSVTVNFAFDSDGTGRYWGYDKDDGEYKWGENGDWKTGKALPEKFTSFKWKQDKKGKKVLCYDGENGTFEYTDASISLKLTEGFSSDIRGEEFIKQ